MLLAHVADLHLGKIFHERDLLPDQAFMLDRLLELLALRRPAALLVAGDVYDRSIPSPEAIGLFDSFLSRAIEADPGLVIVVIPGNHDSAARLSFGAGLFERAGVHLRTRAEDCGRPVLVERGGERLAVWPLPFLSPGTFA
ncbi:MAG: exonuclease subunit SbcD, partial [Treponema sp.]|nr:exonuclease subunit SbcD [Treponema sp.]